MSRRLLYLALCALGFLSFARSFSPNKHSQVKQSQFKKTTTQSVTTRPNRLYGKSIEASNILIKNVEENIYNSTLSSKTTELFGGDKVNVNDVLLAPEMTRQLLRSYSEDSAIIGATLLGVLLGYFWAHGGLLTMSVCGLAGNSIASRPDSIGMVGRIAGGLVAAVFKELPKRNFPNLKNIFDQVSSIGEGSTDNSPKITVLEPKLNKLPTIDSIKSTLQKSFSESYLAQFGAPSSSPSQAETLDSTTPALKDRFLPKVDEPSPPNNSVPPVREPTVDVVFTPSEKFLPRSAAVAKTQEPVSAAVQEMIAALAKVTAEISASDDSQPTSPAPPSLLTETETPVVTNKPEFIYLKPIATETKVEESTPADLPSIEIKSQEPSILPFVSESFSSIDEVVSETASELESESDGSVEKGFMTTSVYSAIAETTVETFAQSSLPVVEAPPSIPESIVEEIKVVVTNVNDVTLSTAPVVKEEESKKDITTLNIPVSFDTETKVEPSLPSSPENEDRSTRPDKVSSRGISKNYSPTPLSATFNAWYNPPRKNADKEKVLPSESLAPVAAIVPPPLPPSPLPQPSLEQPSPQLASSEALPKQQSSIQQPSQPPLKSTKANQVSTSSKVRSLDENLWSNWGKDIQWNSLRRGSDIYSELQRGGNFGGRVAKPAARTFTKFSQSVDTPPPDSSVIPPLRKHAKPAEKEISGVAASPLSIAASLSLQLPLARGAASIKTDAPATRATPKPVSTQGASAGGSEIKYLKRRGALTSSVNRFSPNSLHDSSANSAATAGSFEWFKAASRRIEDTKAKRRI